MSAPEATTTCRTCGSELLAAARFCPECGGRVAADTRLEEAPPPSETGEVPVHVFGAHVPFALLLAAVAALAAAAALLALAAWIAGGVALAIAVFLGGVYLAGARPRFEPRGTTRAAAARARSRAVVEQVAARARLRRELLQLHGELQRLAGERGGRLRALGEAVYAGDEGGTAQARAALRELDDRIAAKEAEMAHVAERARERVAGARLESQSTIMLEPGEPPVPEPYPPPVQEPYPPPDEGTPPTPEPVPEPYPPPDEGDPPRQP